jgi:hypothetical protein
MLTYLNQRKSNPDNVLCDPITVLCCKAHHKSMIQVSPTVPLQFPDALIFRANKAEDPLKKPKPSQVIDFPTPTNPAPYNPYAQTASLHDFAQATRKSKTHSPTDSLAPSDSASNSKKQIPEQTPLVKSSSQTLSTSKEPVNAQDHTTVGPPTTSQPEPPPPTDTASSTSTPAPSTLWSDMVEEDEESSPAGVSLSPTTTGNQPSAGFYLELALIMHRSLTSKTPRRTLRGILDTTRKVTTGKAFNLNFGTLTTSLYNVAQHRHAFDHTGCESNSLPPYRNPGAPECQIPLCLLNVWPRIPDKYDRSLSIAESTKFLVACRNKLTTMNYSSQDIDDANRHQTVLLNAKKPEFHTLTGLCSMITKRTS